MKDYIEKGSVIEITLDTDKVVKVSTKFINTMVEKLGINKEDAILTWCEDEGYLDNEEQEELDAIAKQNKSHKIVNAKAETPTKKTPKERVRKENPTKALIIEEIAKILPNFATNVEIENKEKIITFDMNGESFKIDLVQKRKKKEK
jgi:hypothetical protein